MASIKQAHPRCKTIGQDAHPGMVAYARARVDEVHHADAREPGVADESVDLLVVRFLVWATVTRADARALFDRLVRTVKSGGKILLCGHTPVLLSTLDFAEHALTVERCIAVDDETQSFCQLYALSRAGR